MATKDQNLRMPISLRGIDRRPQDSLPDGALMELINMRLTGGALRPIPEKVRLTNPSPQFKVLFKHVISESVYAFWGTAIVSTVKYLAYQVYILDVAQTPDLDFQAITGDAVFSSLGNVCMISDLTLEKTFVMLFEPDTNTYRPFDKFLPDMPLVQFSTLPLATDDEIKVVILPADASSTDEVIELAFKGTAQEQFARMIKKGYLIGRYLVRCAWELFDGSIVMQTIPAYIKISEIEGMWHAGASVWVNLKFTGYKLQYKINISAGDLVILKAQYKGIVKSFNIYLTNHASLIEPYKAVMTDGTYYSMTIPAGYTSTLTDNWIANEIFYFELVKIGLDSLVAETDTPVSLTDVSTLSSGNVLPAGSLAIHRIFGKNLFSYNQRIFLGNIKNTLFQGTSLYGYIGPGDDDIAGTPYSIGISYDLDTSDGTRRVFTGWFEYNYWSIATGEIKFNFTGTLGYPDARCKSASIWHKSGTTIHFIGSIAMTQVFGMNFSFRGSFPYLPFEGPFTTVLPINETPSYWDGDRVQATEFQNPFYFPAINSYRVEGFVLGMAINTVAFIETGQFGQFPIFTFTTRGIWALNIGNGDILIDKITPLSGTICTNGRSILGIDGGVIFMSNEGLMILSGVNPVSISDMVVGSPLSPMAGQVNYEHIINDPNSYQPKSFLDGVTFEIYAAGANIAFSIVTRSNGMVEKEIIVSNPAYTYSYVYNITSKSWHKITQSWDTFIHDFPKTYGTKLINTIYYLDDLTREAITPTQEIMVHIETRPIKFGEGQSYKKIMRSLIYGLIHSSTDKPFTFYMFGSADGQNWFIQNASNLINPGDKAAIGRSSFSCRSYIFVIGGYVYSDSYIQGLICDIEKKFDNKLR